MSNLFRRLWLGLALILATSAFLLISDAKNRAGSTSAIPKIALFQFNSVKLLDDGVRGVIDRLHENGYEQGRTIIIDKYNAENDMATANSIARQITTGEYKYIVTMSTNCLQVVAGANQAGKAIHIFGLVADPVVAKVGISAANPLDHPKHLIGVGSLMPSGEVMQLARQFNPRIQKFGLPWNPSQANSLRFTELAREAAKKMHVELLEAAVDNTAAVGETVSSLVSRGAETILVLGDLTVALGIDAVVSEARKGKIPVMSMLPDMVPHGALFAAGPDYYAIGKQVGDLTTRVIKGEDPARIPIVYDLPRDSAVNLKALSGLKDEWRIPPEIIAKARQIQ